MDTFINPLPPTNANQLDWQAWMAAEEKSIRKQERKLGTSRLPDDQPTITRKINGIYRQATFTGFAGDGDDCYLEPLTEADQERTIDEARHVLTGRVSARPSGASKRKERKARRNRR